MRPVCSQWAFVKVRRCHSLSLQQVYQFAKFHKKLPIFIGLSILKFRHFAPHRANVRTIFVKNEGFSYLLWMFRKFVRCSEECFHMRAIFSIKSQKKAVTVVTRMDVISLEIEILCRNFYWRKFGGKLFAHTRRKKIPCSKYF